MSLPRLRLEKCTFDGKTWTIDNEQAHHLVRVRRCNTGSFVEGLLNGVRVKLKLLCYENIVCAEEISRENELLPQTNIHLLLGLLKNDQLNEALRFSAEIGVHSIQLLLCERSVPIYDAQKSEDKMQRWNKILEEATKQAGSTRPPILKNPIEITKFDFQSLPNCRYAALLSSEPQQIKNINVPSELAVAIGPEGDWAPSESQLLLDNGFIGISLGKRILRASTAVAVACGSLMLAEDN